MCICFYVLKKLEKRMTKPYSDTRLTLTLASAPTAYLLAELHQTELGVSWILSALLSPSSEHTCLRSHDKTLGKAL